MKNIRVKTNIENLLRETPEAYYWIGLLLTDGHIEHKTKRLIIQLQEKDKEQIERMAQYINCPNIHKVKSKPFKFGRKILNNINTQNAYRLQCQDKENVEKIIKKFDFKPRKTYNPPVLDFDNMDNNLFISLLIGMITGDGSISYNGSKTCFCIELAAHNSWYKILLQLKQKIESFGFKCQNVRLNSRNDMYKLRITNKDFCNYVKDFIKRYNIPILYRKWDKILLA